MGSPDAAPPARTPAVRRLRRGWFLAGLALVATVVWLSLVPIPSPPVAHADKVEHLGTYGTLMLWFAQLGGPARRRAVTAAALVALGVGIEFLQDLTPYRMMDPLDMLANTVGVALGWLGAPPRTPNLLERIARRFAAA